MVAARNTGAADKQTDLNRVQLPTERATDPARTLNQPLSRVYARLDTRFDLPIDLSRVVEWASLASWRCPRA